MLTRPLLPLLKLLLQLKVHPEGLRLNLLQTGQEIQAHLFIIVVQVPQHHNAGDHQEQIGIRAGYQLVELLVFLGEGLYDPREVHQELLFLGEQEVVLSFLPGFLVLSQGLDKIGVVLELGVYHFDVLLVFSEETADVVEGESDLLG